MEIEVFECTSAQRQFQVKRNSNSINNIDNNSNQNKNNDNNRNKSKNIHEGRTVATTEISTG